MSNKQIKIGSMLSYMQMGLNIIISLVYTPIMLKLLGQSEYGLYNTVASTVSMLSILNLGFSSGYIRYYARYKKNNDQESIYKLNGLFMIIFLCIGFVGLCCGLFLTTHLDLVFSNGLTESEYVIARKLMFLMTIHLALSFPMSVFTSIINAHERYIFMKIVGMGKTVLSPLLTIPMLLLGYGSIAIVIVSLVIALIVDALHIYYVFIKLNNRFVFRGFEKGVFKELFIYTSFIAINMIVDQINWKTDKILLGRFKGTSVVAVYSIGAVLQTHYNSFSSAISHVFTPRIHHIANIDDAEKKAKQMSLLFTRIGRLQFIVLGLIMSGFVIFGRSFIRFWTGKGYEESYFVALLLMLPVTIPLIQNTGIEIQRSLNKHKFRSIAYAIMAVINIMMTIPLCQLFGAIGAAAGTAFSLIIANGIIMNIYYHKQCNIDIKAFWKNIAQLSRGLIIPVFSGMIAYSFFANCNIFQMLIGITIYSVIYIVSMWLFGMDKQEKDLFTGFYKRIVRK